MWEGHLLLLLQMIFSFRGSPELKVGWGRANKQAVLQCSCFVVREGYLLLLEL
jgi:hypothetical protein